MKTVREMFVSLTTMLINHIWASIIEICVEKWRTQSLKKFEIQMSRHEKRYRSEEMAPWANTATITIRVRLWSYPSCFLHSCYCSLVSVLCLTVHLLLCQTLISLAFFRKETIENNVSNRGLWTRCFERTRRGHWGNSPPAHHNEYTNTILYNATLLLGAIVLIGSRKRKKVFG